MAEEFLIRFATIDDMQKVFELSNDDVVRANSINQEKINWEEHVEWFNNRIKKQGEPFYIVESQTGEFIAQVRFDKKEKVVISISITKPFRGKGMASKIIKECSQKSRFKKISAFIKDENIASQKSFLKAGYNLNKKENNYLKYEYKNSV